VKNTKNTRPPREKASRHPRSPARGLQGLVESLLRLVLEETTLSSWDALQSPRGALAGFGGKTSQGNLTRAQQAFQKKEQEKQQQDLADKTVSGKGSRPPAAAPADARALRAQLEQEIGHLGSDPERLQKLLGFIRSLSTVQNECPDSRVPKKVEGPGDKLLMTDGSEPEKKD
jgi:hypothetical protein